jgi:predicted TIM-barrel fold metal-dependent hydrolase
VATVFVECTTHYLADGPEAMRPLGETRFVAGVGRAAREAGLPIALVAGMVGRVDLLLGDAAAPVLAAHVEAGEGRLRGIRQITVWHPDRTIRPSMHRPPPGVMTSAAFRQGFRHLAPLGLSFDAWLIHTQLDELLDLARAFPDTRIIVNHVGGPMALGPYRSRRDETFALWSRGIRALGERPNVTMKLGGFGMPLFGLDFALAERAPSSEQVAERIRPFVETCLDAFGARRCMFESNFPVDKGSFSYRVCWNAFKRLAAGASDEERAALFSGTAVEVYRLGAVASG